MNGKHCQSCRCTQMQDKPWLSMTGDGVRCMESLSPLDLERSSFPCHLTDGHWLGRASCPEVIDKDLNNSLGLRKSRFQHSTPSISSMGNLVCSTSTVSALQQCKLSETEFSMNDALSQSGLPSSMNQAPRRDGQPTISEGLMSINQLPAQPFVGNGPIILQLEGSDLGDSALGNGPPVIGNSSILPCEAYQSPTNLFESLDSVGVIDALSAAQISSFINLETTVGHDSGPCIPSYPSPATALSDSQSITGLQSFAEPIPDNGTSLLPGHFNFPALLADLSDRTTEGELLIDFPLIQASDQGEISFSSTHVISPAPSHSAPRHKGRRPFRCPHDDCYYTSNTLRDVQRHLGSRKHGQAHKRFPCLVAGCNSLKDNSRRDNFIRHMETVHRQMVSRMKNGRRPNSAAHEVVCGGSDNRDVVKLSRYVD